MSHLQIQMFTGLTVDIVITNGTILSINDITIKQSGSGYESQNLSGTLYTTSSTGRNYITYFNFFNFLY